MNTKTTSTTTYITKEELTTTLPPSTLRALLGDDDTLLATLITENCSRMASYLSLRYDADALLAARGANRHPALVKCLKSLVTYDLYARQGRGHVGELVHKQQASALRWLEDVAAGRLDPRLPEAKRQVQSPVMGSQASYKSRF